MTTQYSSDGITFSASDWWGDSDNPELANDTLFRDVQTPTLFCLSNLYADNKTNRLETIQMTFSSPASGISLMLNGAGPEGNKIEFTVYDATSGDLVDTVTCPAASGDGTWHSVTIPDSNVGYVQVVSPKEGWGFYLTDIEYTLGTPLPPVIPPQVPMSLTFTLTGSVEDPIPSPNSNGAVKATTNAVKITTATILQLAAAAHSANYPKGALVCVTMTGPGNADSVQVTDKTGTNIVDDISDLLQVNETDRQYQAVGGSWVINPASQLYTSATISAYEMLDIAFDDGNGTSFEFQFPAKEAYSLGVANKQGSQTVTESFSLTAGGEGTAINTKDADNADPTVWIGTVAAAGTHIINQIIF